MIVSRMDQPVAEKKGIVLDIANREWVAAFLVALLTVAVVTLPYALGYALSRPGTVFSGVIMNPEDTQSYFAKMLQGFEGKWLYTIPFTPEQHAPAFLGGFYLALGHLARWTGLTIEGVWHLARIFAGLFLFLVTFGFIGTFLQDRQERWAAYLLALFSSGLGWLLFVLQQPYWLGAFPVDFKMPEAHLFFSAMTFPHVALGTGLVVVSIWLIFQIGNGHPKSWTLSVLAGVTNLAIGIAYPFLIYLVIFTAAIYWLVLSVRARKIDWMLTTRLGISFIIPAPLYLYYAYANQSNDVFRSWADQAVTSSPPWPHYLIAFGTLLLLALLPVAKRRINSRYIDKMTLLWIWIIAAALLVYLPINAQRRFVQGVQIPLSILASVGLIRVFLPGIASTKLYKKILKHPRYTDAGLRRLLITSIILFFSLSNLYVLADVSVTAAIRQTYPFFRQQSELEVVDWLHENTERTAVVLAAYETGNYVAARAGNRVVIGHWAETVNWEEKYDQTNRFYDGSTEDSWRRELIDSYGISYIWHGPTEKTLGTFDPSSASYLTPIYEVAGTKLYEVD
jgi:hypothetical protein